MNADIFDVGAVVLSFVIGLIASRNYYKKFKEKLMQVRRCIDKISDALEDDRVTREEILEIVRTCKEIIK